jgi:hypothetical protein
MVGGRPKNNYYKPRGVPLALLEEVVLAVDEYEGLRLADLAGLYQEDAALKMGVSRQTFGRIIESAHRKVADALINGKALRIEGGNFAMPEGVVSRCRHGRGARAGRGGKPGICPRCAIAKKNSGTQNQK